MKKLLLAMAIPAMLTGCSESQQPQKQNNSGLFGLHWFENKASIISVVSIDGKPLANAKVLIGNALNSPFTGNYLTTGANGKVAIPAGWTSPAAVTVEAPGYIRSTFLNQNPGSISMILRPRQMSLQAEVKGVATGLPIKDKDGFIDFGLVMPAFSKLDLLAFNVNSVISPQTDKITVIGQEVPLPSNISLPRQTERYSIISITLDKPNYRIYFGNNNVNRIFAARGRFPFKSTVDAIRGGAEFSELINTFSLTGGVIRDVETKPGSTPLNLPVNELSFTDKTVVKAPTIRADEIFVAVGVSSQSGYMIPTDIKKVVSNGSTNLNLLAGSDKKILGAVMKAEDLKNNVDRMSAALYAAENVNSPKLLPLIDSPQIQGDFLILPAVNTIEGVNQIAVYSVLSKEETVQQGNSKAVVLNPQWEVFASQWPANLEIPQWPDAEAVPGKKRWEVNYVGSQTASQVNLGPDMIEAATHVTHSSVSFQ